MASIVEIILKGTDKTSKMFKDVDKSSKGLLESLKAIGLTAGAIAGVGIAAKKAFDLGLEGATVAQTAESFDLLLEKVHAAPDLLDQLSAASRGTISQMDLMSSTATLLAGTQGDLAEQLAASTPRLLEIAKAANKLNPALGDTAFMYQSIATGVKRAQPLILDNLGLTIKIGEANEKYAKSIGKTVEQLTAEEKAMALLEETLRAGDIMIDQVGGTTESATDSFLRAEAAMEDLGNTIKTIVAPAIADESEKLATQASNFLEVVEIVREYGLHMNLLKGWVDEHGQVVAEGGKELVIWAAAQKEAEKQTKAAAQAIRDAKPDWFELNKEVRKGVTAAEEVAAANRDVVLSLSEITQAELAREVMEELNQAWEEGIITTDEYKALFNETAETIGGLPQDTIDAQIGLFDLRQEIIAQQPELRELISLYREFGSAIGAIPSLPVMGDVVVTGGGGGAGAGGTGIPPTTTETPPYVPGESPRGGNQQTFNIYPSNDLDVEEMVQSLAEAVSER